MSNAYLVSSAKRTIHKALVHDTIIDPLSGDVDATGFGGAEEGFEGI